MSLLGALALGLVVEPTVVLLAKVFCDLLLALCQCLNSQVHRVGTHVGNQTLLVEVLRNGHRLRNAHAEFTAGLLLQGRGGKGRCRETLCRFLFALRNAERGTLAREEELLSLLRRVEALRQFGTEEGLLGIVLGIELCHDTEIGGRVEGDDLAFALHDEAYGYRLHATGRERRTYLFPKYGRELKTHQTIQYATCLLGIHERHVDRARLLDGLQDGLLRDLVEDDTLRLINRETQHFGQVPCDGLSFAVFIGSQPNGLLLGQLREFAHDLFLVGGNLVDRCITISYLDTQTLLGQVADVAETGANHEVATEKFLDGFGFGR